MLFYDNLQMIKISGRTGAISVPVGESEGRIYFENGLAIHAYLDDLRGDAALLRILQTTTNEPGNFIDGETTPERSIKKSLDFLMLEAARLRDEAPAAPPPQPPSAGGEAWARLTPMSDADSPPLILRNDREVLGRFDNCDLIIPHPSVSKHHCVFEKADGKMQVADLNSSNGTFINGAQIQASDLHFGDVLQFGPVLYRFDPPQVTLPVPPPQPTPQDKNSRTAALTIPPVRSSSKLMVKLPPRYAPPPKIGG
ncbi:MAG: FHA domain-containing protein [Verrucomicrobiia bacterium]